MVTVFGLCAFTALLSAASPAAHLRVSSSDAERACPYDDVDEAFRCRADRLQNVVMEKTTLVLGAHPVSVTTAGPSSTVWPSAALWDVPEKNVCLRLVSFDVHAVNTAFTVDPRAVRVVVNGVDVDDIEVHIGRTTVGVTAEGGQCLQPPTLAPALHSHTVEVWVPYVWGVHRKPSAVRWSSTLQRDAVDENTALAAIARPELSPALHDGRLPTPDAPVQVVSQVAQRAVYGGGAACGAAAAGASALFGVAVLPFAGYRETFLLPSCLGVAIGTSVLLGGLAGWTSLEPPPAQSPEQALDAKRQARGRRKLTAWERLQDRLSTTGDARR